MTLPISIIRALFSLCLLHCSENTEHQLNLAEHQVSRLAMGGKRSDNASRMIDMSGAVELGQSSRDFYRVFVLLHPHFEEHDLAMRKQRLGAIK
jgi:hypothetical protein